MKRLIIVFFMCPFLGMAQLEEDFEEQDLSGWIQSQPGAWDTSSVQAINGKYSLRHVFDNPVSGQDQISLCIDSLQPEKGIVTWKFCVRHAYNPSAANNWSVFLLSDCDARQMHPGGEASGIVLGVNFTGSDDLLKMWKKSGKDMSVLFNSNLNWEIRIGTERLVCFEITRSITGWWTVKIDTVPDDSYEPGTIGYIKDEWIPMVKHFGIYYEYSSKQDGKFWLDDLFIQGVFARDTIPPVLVDLEVETANILVLTFSEPLDTTGLKEKGKYLMNQESICPDSVFIKDEKTLVLFFSGGFTDGRESELRLFNITDRKGNITSEINQNFIYYRPKKYDVIINEIMADPEPAIGLPEFEYIEIYNRSEYDIDLDNWRILFGEMNRRFPEILLESHEYLILVYPKAADYFVDYNRTLGLLASKTSLSNNGSMIILEDQTGCVISFVEYKPDWHIDDYRSQGGWSLERIDTENFCGGSDNWTSCGDREGGTPGTKNSVYAYNPDHTAPTLHNAVCLNNQTIRLDFDEPMDSLSLISNGNFYLDHGINNPYHVSVLSPTFSTVFLFFDKELQRKVIYHLKLEANLCDCAGNTIDQSIMTKVALAELPERNDILFSEVLFNPLPGGVDFIELFNFSDKVVDLKDILLATWDDKLGSMNRVCKISDDNLMFFPEEYILLTPDVENILQYYSVSNIDNYIEMPSFPSLADKYGRILLLDKWLKVIDDFSYSEDMHFKLLNSLDGVSLERISFKNRTNDQFNWHSAAEIYGFATPGYENSQMLKTEYANSPINIKPHIFTPDNDGFHDFVNIVYQFNQPGCVATIMIFDPRGRKVKTLLNNELLGVKGSFKWDGLDDSGRLARTGIYLIYIEVFELEGNVRKYKKTCILSGRKLR